jgi:hypothetical protein
MLILVLFVSGTVYCSRPGVPRSLVMVADTLSVSGSSTNKDLPARSGLMTLPVGQVSLCDSFSISAMKPQIEGASGQLEQLCIGQFALAARAREF